LYHRPSVLEASVVKYRILYIVYEAESVANTSSYDLIEPLGLCLSSKVRKFISGLATLMK
jgi:hypothetical protein